MSMEYRIIKTSCADAYEIDWDKVPAAPISNVCWGYGRDDIFAQAQLCYNEENLFVRMSALENNIRAEYQGLMGMPCEDSCLEFFFSPLIDGRYFNIEFNPNGSMFLGFGKGPESLCRLLTGDPPYNILRPTAERTFGGWRVTYTVPLEFIRMFCPGFRFESTAIMSGNFYKCGDLTVKEHYYSWNPMTIDHPQFHYPHDFGTLVFE